MKTGGLTTPFVFLRCTLQIEQLQSDLTSAQQREAELKTMTATQSTTITVPLPSLILDRDDSAICLRLCHPFRCENTVTYLRVLIYTMMCCRHWSGISSSCRSH